MSRQWITNLLTGPFCVDRITLLKMLFFWINLFIYPGVRVSWCTYRGQLIQQEKTTLYTWNYLSAVLNNKSTLKYVITYNPHLQGSLRSPILGSVDPCWGQLIHGSTNHIYGSTDPMPKWSSNPMSAIGILFCMMSLASKLFWQCSNYMLNKLNNHHPNLDHHIYNSNLYSPSNTW